MNAAPRFPAARTAALLLAALPFATCALADAPKPGPPLTIHHATGPIVLDGNLDDAGWQGVEPDTTWFETNVGDNVQPQVANAAYLAYDDHFLYAGFRFSDPHPELIRAPLGDHDALSGATDYAGIIVDSRNDGRTAQMFLANPKGLQYDAVSSDVSGEDNSPDFYWDATGKVTPTGWNLEIRVPFSSLRYSGDAQPTWGMLLYRNYPRQRRYQFFTARLPRDVNCFICNSSKMSGLAGLPHGSHLVAAPFATAEKSDLPRGGTVGNPLENGDLQGDGGVDVKWTPLANVAIDATLNPDFSQVESDAAKIGTNERFALFYPEKRSFFLEGVDLFSTPFSAVYTRTINSPSGGLRATGRFGATSYTALVAHDRGGGLAILPGPQGSDEEPLDLRSDVGIVRMRHDLGASFVSLLATGREIDGGGHNHVFGPDFQWRPRPSDSFTGQALWSESRTPNQPALSPEWDGRTLQDRALLLNYQHGTAHVDVFAQGQDLGAKFRADDGYIPQVGYREGFFETGYTIRPKDQFLSRVRLWTIEYLDAEPGGHSLAQRVSAGAGMDGKWTSFLRVELNRDAFRVGDAYLWRFRPRVNLTFVPGRVVNNVSLDAYFGDEIDFANGRQGRGTTLLASVYLRPSDHLELKADASQQRLNVDVGGGHEGRLFNTNIDRLRATWSFNSRSFLRLIGQASSTTRDATLYDFPVRTLSESFSGSALFAYKLNWQTVLFAGYGDEQTYTPLTDRYEPAGRHLFAKVSYALQQ